MNTADCIIVPDVHGRTFWKDAKEYKDCDVIFLGDYLDPYAFEHITPKEALDNFIEILDFAKSNERVTLLLGNHDCEYAISTNVCNCRCDYSSFNDIRNLFFENAGLFKFAAKRAYANHNYLFTHAGLHSIWMLKCNYGVDDVCNMKYCKNFDLEDDTMKFADDLCYVSRHRGGWGHCASPVWTDVQDYFTHDEVMVPYEQITGHNMLKDSPVHIHGITCVDIRRICVLDKSGNLCEKDMSKMKVINVNQ